MTSEELAYRKAGQPCGETNRLLSNDLGLLEKDRDVGISFSMTVDHGNGDAAKTAFRLSIGFSYLEDDRVPSFDSRIMSATIFLSPETAAEAARHGQMTKSLRELDRHFSGTSDEFMAALPGFVARAAAALSFDSSKYQLEYGVIAKALHTCSQITPEIAGTTRNRYPNGQYGPPNIAKLGSEFDMCKRAYHNVSSLARAYDKTRERGLIITISHSEAAAYWGQQPGLAVYVYFEKLGADASERLDFNSLGIVGADIH